MEVDSPDIPLIRTKLHRPPVATVHVLRRRLLDLLNPQIHPPLILVSAPAGYGKSTLVSKWLEGCDVPSAWLSIDETDNDLHLFLSYLLAAVQTVFPEFGREIQNILRAKELPPLPILSVHLINELDRIDQAFILVIDDYHVIQNRAIHELLEKLLKHPPHALRLVLASRIDPPLPLTALRARGLMTEIRARDLRFSRNETAEFLQQILETTIDDSIVAKFEEQSEGWITGLHLAALSLRHKEDIERVKSGLPDDNRFVMDYLVAEILSKQPPTIQEFLLKTSILGRFCAPLCDAVCFSDTDSVSDEIRGQEFLELLKNANLFSIGLDDERAWYRYHHLFRSLLERKLNDRFTPEDIRLLHTNASTWFAENGYFEEAIKHAMTVSDVDRAAEIVGRARHALMNTDQWNRLERWLKLFSREAVQKYPHLTLLRCWLDYYHWYRLGSLVKDLDRADVVLETAVLDTRESGLLKAEVAAMRSNLAYWILEPSHGIERAEQVLRDSPDGHECVRSTALFGMGGLYQMLGEMRRGEHLLWGHMEDGRFKSPSSQCRLLQSLCISYWPEANTRKLRRAGSRLLQLSLEANLSWNESYARYFLGLSHYERNELNDAVAQFEIIVGHPHRFPIHNVAHCSFLLSLSYQALGLPDQARKVAESISVLAFERGNEMFIGLAEAFQADLNLHQGRIAPAEQWAIAFVAPDPHAMQRFFNAELTSIKVMLARNTSESLKSSAEQLDSMQKLLGRSHHRRLMIDVLGMKALLADALGQESSAFEKLSESLILAEPSTIIRPFLDLGHQMADLLRRFEKHKPDQKFIEKIIVGFSNEQTLRRDEPDVPSLLQSLSNKAQVEPLTNREIDILSILSKRFRNQEIAERLFISPETVKRHLYNIYQKIDVKNRQQAIAKAKSLGIL